MKIAIVVEGKTEMAFKPHLVRFLEARLPGKMPKLDMLPYDGRIPTGAKLKRIVVRLLEHVAHPANAVIALTDVYTGSQPPEFENAEAAKAKMRRWVGDEERFFPHVAFTTSRLGCCHIGRKSKRWRAAIARRSEPTRKKSTTVNRLPATWPKFFERVRAEGITLRRATPAAFSTVRIC